VGGGAVVVGVVFLGFGVLVVVDRWVAPDVVVLAAGDLALWCCARAPRTARTATAATTMTAAAMGPPSRRGRWFMLDIALSRPRPEIAFSEMGAGPVPSSNTRGLARGWLGMWPQLGDSVEATGMRSPSSPPPRFPGD